jgi:hypothetical protein
MGGFLNMEVKQEDLIRFWTWCGFSHNTKTYHYFKGARIPNWIEPSGEITNRLIPYLKGDLPILSLNTIYDHAIPKLQDEGYSVELLAYECYEFGAFLIDVIHDITYPEVRSENPAEALYKAILQVIDKETK